MSKLQSPTLWLSAVDESDRGGGPVHLRRARFRELVLKNRSLTVIAPDMAFLTIFTVLAMAIATLLFRRTL